jgi:hypothetical protein
MTAVMIEAALRALAFAIAVGASLRLLRVRNVPVRKAAWSVVLIASLAMPFLMRWPAAAGWAGRFAWAVPIRVKQLAVPQTQVKTAPAVLRASDDTPVTLPASTAVAPSPVAISAVPDDVPLTLTVASTEAPRPTKFQWPPAGRLIAMMYLAVSGVLLLRLLWGLVVALRLWMTADLVSPLVAPEPHVRSSQKIPSPVTLGSGIVLPASYIEWDMKKLKTVLAHERSHVRQFDFYLQVLASLYTALFWFSPLGWWLRRALTSLGEAIGDRAGIDAAASRSSYAEILIEFAAMPRQTLPGVAMARPGNLAHRIERLLNEHLFRSAFAEGRRRAVVSLLLIPVALFAATALIRVSNAAAQTAPPVPASAPPPQPAAAPDDQSAPPPAQNTVEPAPAPIPGAPNPAAAPAAPGPAAAPPAAVGPATPVLASGDALKVDDSDDALVSDDDQTVNGFSYRFSNDGESYAIVEGPGSNITFSGSWGDNRKAELDAARKVAKGPFLWFTHNGKSYVVDDPAIVARIRAMYKPMEGLGQRQEQLGKQQEALGKQQEELAREQEQAGAVKLPDLSREMADVDAAVARAKEEQDKWNTKELADVEAKLKAEQDQTLTPEKVSELQAKLAAAQAEWSSERMAEMQAKLGELQARLGELQGAAGERQGEFGEKMGKLGAEQGALGAQQGKLGAEQGRLAREADRQVRSIIEECLRNGKATQLQDVK